MALVLDGNGPITGLSSLTFPGNAGTVSGLANNSIPISKLGSGGVIQIQNLKLTSLIAISASGVTDIGLNISMTVTQSSKILMIATVPIYNDGGGSTWTNAGMVYFYYGGTGGTQLAYTEHNGTTTAEAACWQHHTQFMTDAFSAGTYTFSAYYSRTIAGTHNVSRDNRARQLTLMEIAA